MNEKTLFEACEAAEYQQLLKDIEAIVDKCITLRLSEQLGTRRKPQRNSLRTGSLAVVKGKMAGERTLHEAAAELKVTTKTVANRIRKYKLRYRLSDSKYWYVPSETFDRLKELSSVSASDIYTTADLELIMKLPRRIIGTLIQVNAIPQALLVSKQNGSGHAYRLDKQKFDAWWSEDSPCFKQMWGEEDE